MLDLISESSSVGPSHLHPFVLLPSVLPEALTQSLYLTVTLYSIFF